MSSPEDQGGEIAAAGADDPAPAAAEAAAEGDPLAAELRRELGEAIVALGLPMDGGELSVEVRREEIARVAAILRSRFRYTVLVDLCAVDFLSRAPRFEVVYHVYSFRENRRLRLRVGAAEGTPVPSVSGVWRAAEWLEREVYDLFGIEFGDHPDLVRILLWEGFAGHPLRKDFPLAGRDTGAALLPSPEEAPAGAPGDTT